MKKKQDILLKDITLVFGSESSVLTHCIPDLNNSMPLSAQALEILFMHPLK
jgi:hypothetical protein